MSILLPTLQHFLDHTPSRQFQVSANNSSGMTRKRGKVKPPTFPLYVFLLTLFSRRILDSTLRCGDREPYLILVFDVIVGSIGCILILHAFAVVLQLCTK